MSGITDLKSYLDLISIIDGYAIDSNCSMKASWSRYFLDTMVEVAIYHMTMKHGYRVGQLA